MRNINGSRRSVSLPTEQSFNSSSNVAHVTHLSLLNMYNKRLKKRRGKPLVVVLNKDRLDSISEELNVNRVQRKRKKAASGPLIEGLQKLVAHVPLQKKIDSTPIGKSQELLLSSESELFKSEMSKLKKLSKSWSQEEVKGERVS